MQRDAPRPRERIPWAFSSFSLGAKAWGMRLSTGLTQPGSPVCEPVLPNDSRLVFGVPLGGKEGGLTAFPGASRGIREIVDDQSVLYYQPNQAKAWARPASWVVDLRYAELADAGKFDSRTCAMTPIHALYGVGFRRRLPRHRRNIELIVSIG